MKTLGAATLALLAAAAGAEPSTAHDARGSRSFHGEGLSFPIPDGYADVTVELRKKGMAEHDVALLADAERQGYQPTIVFKRAPIAGGTMADAAQCKAAGSSIAGAASGTLESSAIIDGPAGKSCQLRIVAPRGVALITELNRPNETWLMTCNHAVADRASDKICRAVLAGFRFAR